MPIAPKTAREMDIRTLLDQGAILLDIRTAEEFVGFHLPGALHIPFDELALNLESIRQWQQPVIVYGANDRRSSMAASRLRRWGIFALDGGSREDVQELLR